MVRPTILASLAFLMPVSLNAQGRMMMPAASHAVAAAPRGMPHAGQTAVFQAVPAARSPVRTAAPRLRASAAPVGRISRRHAGMRRDGVSLAATTDFIPVPGLGFDMVHLAATRGPEAVGAGRHRRQQLVFFPFIDGGFFPSSQPVIVEEAAAPGTGQEENEVSEAAEAPRRAHVSQPAPAVPRMEEASAVPHLTEEFVFVRRDGTVFFAVAYAWENGTLRYVTSEGLRRTVTRETLDLDATQQFNEQRGLNFRLPA
jgi:hypothetical protein